MITMDKQTFLKTSEDYFRGAFSMLDHDLPDGAWFQAHVDMAESVLGAICKDMGVKKPQDVDGHDITHHYLRRIHE